MVRTSARPQISQKVAVAVVYVAAMFMNILDTTIVNVALPTLGRQFHTTTVSVDAVVISYLVSLAVFIPTSGWMGDRFGGRRVLLAAIVVFTGASALCGLSQSLGQLVAFRIVQGVGGGLMTPVGMAMLYRAFPPAERVRASSILVIPTAMAPALGPVLGGLFVTEVSWRWVFFLNLPIGLAAIVFGTLFVANTPQESPGRFDLTGFLLAGCGLGLLMYGLSEGPLKGWGSTPVVVTAAAGATLLATLVRVELRRADPLVDLRLYSDRLFRSVNLVLFPGIAAFLGTLYLVALFFQDGLGLSALGSGLSTFPEALGVMGGAQIVSRFLYPNFGPRRVMLGGLSVLAASMAVLSLVGFGTSLWLIRLVLFTVGIGMSGMMVSSQAAAFATISSASTGRASTLFNAQRQLGSALGVAFLSTVVAAVGPFHLVGRHLAPNLTAYHTAFLAAAALVVVAGVAATTVSDRLAAGTMVKRKRGVVVATPVPADAPASVA